jgi:peptidoglycan/xylan/chitin deacetylase (PgdA/CDA1 family)
MLHRFNHPARGVRGHDVDALRVTLAWLRRERFQLLSLVDVFRRLQDGAPPLERAVAFTIDDGYADHAEVAAPAFAEFDCPVTTFIVSGFLDGTLWLWWDRIAYVFTQTSRASVEMLLGGASVRYTWSGAPDRRTALLDFTERCKQVPEREKLAAIERLASALDVDVPATPPPEYAPMGWNDLRRVEQRGMRFGPHTVTHPILARTGDAQGRQEIAESWRRLSQEASAPVPIFCYPNGGLADFGAREIGVMRDLGLLGAVTGVTGYASMADFHDETRGSCRVRRFAFPDELPGAAQYAGGFERLKAIIRGGR